MAFNFPATAGQATDGTFTYSAAGITYAWNGESWVAAGAGGSATDLTVFSVTTTNTGTAALSYDSNTGIFEFTPPDLSGYATTASIANAANWDTAYGWGDHSTAGYLTAEADTLNTVTGRGATTTNNITVGGLTAGGLTYPTSNGTSGQVLTSDGAGNVSWSTPSGLQTRTTAQATASNVVSNGTANISITTPATYALLKIQTSHAAWVTLYTDTTSRTNDASRTEQTDPTPGSGVIAEVITAGAATQLISPGTIGFNSAGTGTTYAKVVNKSGATASITVTLHYVQLEG